MRHFTNGSPSLVVCITTSLMKRMKELEDETRRLKKMYAEENPQYFLIISISF